MDLMAPLPELPIKAPTDAVQNDGDKYPSHLSQTHRGTKKHPNPPEYPSGAILRPNQEAAK